MRIELDKAAAVLIDMQERLFPHMHQNEELLKRTKILLAGLTVLGVPTVATEQYPRGLGPTLSAIRELIPEVTPIEKASFSCYAEPRFRETLGSIDRRTIIVAGIEAHVCVQQTILDLLEAEYLPILVTDATSSRNPKDMEIALRRLEREGARLATVESILFEMTRVAGTPQFKEISSLVK